MVDINGQYDPNATGLDNVPAGTYRAEVIEAKREPISKNNDYGDCLSLTWKIQGGAEDGRLMWQRISLWATNMNKIDTVKNIASATLNEVLKAVGKAGVGSTDELLHIPAMVTYGPQKKDPKYSDVKKVEAVGTGSGTGHPATNGAAQQQGATGQTAWG